MAQNIYDNEEFFEGYSRLNRSVHGLAGAPEWPALRSMLPDFRGADVLDLGCGFGWFCRWVREKGAARVHGIDISEKMLARAAATTQDPMITYQRADLETLALPDRAYRLVFSSLAFHYVANLDRLMAEIARGLVPGGSLVFSVEHPIYTAPANPGWVTDLEGHKTWPVNSYQNEGPRSTDWLAKGVIKQHRLIATYVNLLIERGFTITHLNEWGPTEAQISAQPELAEERERPMFVLISARLEKQSN